MCVCVCVCVCACVRACVYLCTINEPLMVLSPCTLIIFIHMSDDALIAIVVGCIDYNYGN